MTYETPTITDLGSLTDLTNGTQVGNALDASFPAGTPRGQLTFS